MSPERPRLGVVRPCSTLDEVDPKYHAFLGRVVANQITVVEFVRRMEPDVIVRIRERCYKVRRDDYADLQPNRQRRDETIGKQQR